MQKLFQELLHKPDTKFNTVDLMAGDQCGYIQRACQLKIIITKVNDYVIQHIKD